MTYSKRQREFRQRARELEPVLALLKTVAPNKTPRELAKAARAMLRDMNEQPLVVLGQGDYRRVVHPKRRNRK